MKNCAARNKIKRKILNVWLPFAFIMLVTMLTK